MPLYYEGRTLIGKAKIDGNRVEIEFDEPEKGVSARMQEGLVGISLVNRGVSPSRFEEEITTKEKSDE